MRKFDILKSVQTVAFVALAALVAYVLRFKATDLAPTIASDNGVRLLFIMLWVTLGVSFIFILFDFFFFSKFKKEYIELDFSIHSDPVAGIANRQSSDAIIERYLEQDYLPQNFGVVMIEIANIKDINTKHGHAGGNKAIREFASILGNAAEGIGFASRNGGNKFMVLLEDCDKELLAAFLAKFQLDIKNNNADPESTYNFEYRYGMGYNEVDKQKSITDLISLADRRIRDPYESSTH